jgi:hypothetical protein
MTSHQHVRYQEKPELISLPPDTGNIIDGNEEYEFESRSEFFIRPSKGNTPHSSQNSQSPQQTLHPLQPPEGRLNPVPN